MNIQFRYFPNIHIFYLKFVMVLYFIFSLQFDIMEDFLKYVRERFILPDLIHLTDVDDGTLKSLMFQNGPSRNEFITFFVYKLLLDIDLDSKDSQNHSNNK